MKTSLCLSILAAIFVLHVDVVQADDSRTFSDPQHHIKMTCPSGWSFMSPAEVAQKSNPQIDLPAGTLVLCHNLKYSDQSINIAYYGDTTRDAPTKDAVRAFLEKLQQQEIETLKQRPELRRIVSQSIYDFADGLALETLAEVSPNGTAMKIKTLFLISHGNGYVITCGAKTAEYDQANKSGFTPVLSSIIIE